MSNRTTYQGGSLLSFVLVGVLFAAVFLGGLYGLHQYNQTVEQSETEIASDQNDTTNETQSGFSDSSTDENAKDEDTKEQNKDKMNEATTDSDKASGDTKASDESAKDTRAEEADKSEKTAESLPQTGPADTLMQLVAVGLLVFAASTYIHSRRSL